MPEITGISHVALTVSDLDASTAWYERLLDAQTVMRMGEPGDQLRTNGLLTPGGVFFALNQHTSTPREDRFSEFRIGLDHLSFGCADRSAVEAWQAKLEQLGISHSGITDAGYAHVLVFRDPDNIQVEFFAPLAG
jgi:catechol 2,3-dioxygenase-like lactoylglutathione lyase family enzyme